MKLFYDFIRQIMKAEVRKIDKKVLVEVKDLRKVFRLGKEKVVAIDHMAFDIHAGEICCILGTSGSGKSTLLNMMAGLEKPTKGYVKILNHEVTKMNEKKLALFRQKHVGFVFQSYNLMQPLTALENVSMPLMFRGVHKKKRNKEAKELLTAVGLGTHTKHKPNQMSGGQQQRVGIARSFVGTPDVIFADEPTGNLDSKTSEEVLTIMESMVRNKHQALVIVTHDTNVTKIADKIIHVLDGRIEKIEYVNKEAKVEMKEAVIEVPKEEIKEVIKEKLDNSKKIQVKTKKTAKTNKR